MHEYSIAHNIAEIIRQSTPEEDLRSVRTIKLKIGTMAGVVVDSLIFCFDAIKDTLPFSDALLDVEQSVFTVHCNVCESVTTNELGVAACSICGSFDTTILSGYELEIVSIEIEENAEEMQWA
ncbi:MAG: hydrogenase maturation nickel metallochaperone HypA [Bacteroidota bacterium]